jgi:OmpA-OmpF porin, OOP family
MELMKISGKVTIAMAMLLLASIATADDLDKSIVGPTENIRLQAEQADANLLSPKIYMKGVRSFDLAKDYLAKDKDPDRVRKKLAEADTLFRQAQNNSEVAKLTLMTAIESRAAAQKAEAARLVTNDWIMAEKTFNAAVLALESGNQKAALRKHEEANIQFRTAELNAIRTFVLAEAWQLLTEINNKKLDIFVPQTLDQAKQLITRAEDLIITDRYALDEPMILASQAINKAQYAIYIGTLAGKIKVQDLSVEALILQRDSSLLNIAKAANVESDLSFGPDKTSAEIILLLEELPGLRSDLQDRNALITGLEEEIRELDAALGGASADRSQLIRRLEQQARIREQFRQIENMFSSNEAVVLRNGNNLIIRLVGLSFASGSTELGPDTEILLTKAQTAIEVFPQCSLTVEGHTDTTGKAKKNLALSDERAQSVKTYMTEVMRIPAFRIEAVGYGDTRPVANNKTDQGRARNRRIDLIITPNPESL